MGESHKPEAFRASAHLAASTHKDRLYEALSRYSQVSFCFMLNFEFFAHSKLLRPFLRALSLQQAAQRANVRVAVIQPPPVIPSAPLPVATSPEDQVSRHEGAVRCVKWHPRQAVLASAASTVGVWVP
jgi:hypothetical protein